MPNDKTLAETFSNSFSNIIENLKIDPEQNNSLVTSTLAGPILQATETH